MGIIYKATNKLDGRIYIGCTVSSLERRKSEHIRSAASGSMTEFHKALRRFGMSEFYWDILEKNISDRILGDREQYWIGLLRSNYPGIGYNMQEGGFGRYARLSEDVSEKRDLLSTYPRTSSSVLKDIWRIKKESGEDLMVAGRKIKRVLCITNGKVYRSVMDASKDTGVNHDYIYFLCRGGKQKTDTGKYSKWKFQYID